MVRFMPASPTDTATAFVEALVGPSRPYAAAVLAHLRGRGAMPPRPPDVDPYEGDVIVRVLRRLTAAGTYARG